MTMQRRHYELIAEVIATAPFVSVRGPLDRDTLAQHFADRLAQTNPKFDRARFLRACGVV
jgi:hypothetical protein